MPKYIVFGKGREHHLLSFAVKESEARRRVETKCGIRPGVHDRVIYRRLVSINICPKCQKAKHKQAGGR